MRIPVKIAMWFLIALVGAIAVVYTNYPWPLTGGPVHGVVIDAKSNRPVPDATVVVKWIGHLSGSHGPRYPCYHVALAQSDNEGKFYVPAWTMKTEDGPRWLQGMSTEDMQKPLAVAAYRGGYFMDRAPEPYSKDVTVLLKMEPFVGTTLERLRYLSGFIEQPIMCEADDTTLIPIYKAAYEEERATASSPEELTLVDSLLVGLESAQYGNNEALRRAGTREVARLKQNRN